MEQFTFGTATASFQVEGALDVDGRGRSIWDDRQDEAGAIANGDRADHCCRSYEHWRDDLGLLTDLGVDAYRFSVAWPRIVPDGDGAPNPAGLDHYDRMVDDLLAAGIEPWVTLFHWDLPSALQARGGFAERTTTDAYARYVEVVARRLGDRVPAFITINEPGVFTWLGHAFGVHAPSLQDRGTALRVAHELLVAHGRAVDVLREHAPAARVGIALDVNVVDPADPRDDAHVEAARLVDGMHFRWFLDPLYGRGRPEDVATFFGADVPDVRDGDLDVISRPTDFLGVNHYRRQAIAPPEPGSLYPGREVTTPGAPVTGFGWEVHPEGIAAVLHRLHADYAPGSLVVTENGAAYDDRPGADGFVQDDDRIAYLSSYLDHLLAARADGVPVDGWFVWSLLDNFEWSEGFRRRFGLVRTEAGTATRIPKASFAWYRDRIRQVRQPNP